MGLAVVTPPSSSKSTVLLFLPLTQQMCDRGNCTILMKQQYRRVLRQRGRRRTRGRGCPGSDLLQYHAQVIKEGAAHSAGLRGLLTALRRITLRADLLLGTAAGRQGRGCCCGTCGWRITPGRRARRGGGEPRAALAGHPAHRIR